MKPFHFNMELIEFKNFENDTIINGNKILQAPDPTFGYFHEEDSIYWRLTWAIFFAVIAMSGAWAIRKIERFLKNARKTMVNKITRVENIIMIYSISLKPKVKLNLDWIRFLYFRHSSCPFPSGNVCFACEAIFFCGRVDEFEGRNHLWLVRWYAKVEDRIFIL